MYELFAEFKDSGYVKCSSLEELSEVRRVILQYEPDADLQYVTDDDYYKGFRTVGVSGEWCMWTPQAFKDAMSFSEWMEAFDLECGTQSIDVTLNFEEVL